MAEVDTFTLTETENINKNDSNPKISLVARKIKCMPLSEIINSGNLSGPSNSTQENILKHVMKKRKVQERQSRNKTPQAIAVARRNARERNRVKQVNNGFAALREHIPESIAENFEQSSCKNSAKKLSKVETLRMAVCYIKELESMLCEIESNTNSISLPATPPPECMSQQNCFFAVNPQSTFQSTETEIAIIGGQQYVRIPGTNTFQLIQIRNTDFEDEENVKPDLSVLPTGSIIQNNVLNISNGTISSLDSYGGEHFVEVTALNYMNQIKKEPETEIQCQIVDKINNLLFNDSLNINCNQIHPEEIKIEKFIKTNSANALDFINNQISDWQQKRNQQY